MERERSQEAYVNKTALILFTVLTGIISVAYIVQFAKGEAGWGLFLPIEIFDLLPMILGWAVYKANNDSPLIKHIIAVGYGVFYLILCMISTNTVLVFVYALPTVIMVSMFNDFRLSVTSGVGVSIIATIHAIKYANFRNWEGGAVADLEIEVLIMIICSVFSIVVNKVITTINNERMSEIHAAGDKTTHMLDEIMEVSGGIIDDAIRDLNVEYIDLLLIHQPGADDEGVYKAMEDAVNDGRLRSIGISNYYTKEQVDEVLSFATIKPSVIQNENHIYYQNTELQEYVKQYGIVIESWYPFGGRGHTSENFNNEVIKELSDEYDKTSAQIILRWQLQAGFIAIPGSSNPDHIAENYDIFDFELSEENMQKISLIDEQRRYESW